MTGAGSREPGQFQSRPDQARTIRVLARFISMGSPIPWCRTHRRRSRRVPPSVTRLCQPKIRCRESGVRVRVPSPAPSQPDAFLLDRGRAITPSAFCASSSAGRASASQAEGRGSEPRLALSSSQFGAAMSSRSASRRTRRQSGSLGTAATALRYMRTASPIRPTRRKRSP